MRTVDLSAKPELSGSDQLPDVPLVQAKPGGMLRAV